MKSRTIKKVLIPTAEAKFISVVGIFVIIITIIIIILSKLKPLNGNENLFSFLVFLLTPTEVVFVCLFTLSVKNKQESMLVCVHTS